MNDQQKSPRDKLDIILEKLEHIDNRLNNVKGWVTFIGIFVLLGLIVALLSPVCGSLLK